MVSKSFFVVLRALPSRTVDSVGYRVASCEPCHGGLGFADLFVQAQIRCIHTNLPGSSIRETELEHPHVSISMERLLLCTWKVMFAPPGNPCQNLPLYSWY